MYKRQLLECGASAPYPIRHWRGGRGILVSSENNVLIITRLTIVVQRDPTQIFAVLENFGDANSAFPMACAFIPMLSTDNSCNKTAFAIGISVVREQRTLEREVVFSGKDGYVYKRQGCMRWDVISIDMILRK